MDEVRIYKRALMDAVLEQQWQTQANGHETFAAYLKAHQTLAPAPLTRVTPKG